jgi:hypothetical protein
VNKLIDISKELAPAFFKNPEFKKGSVLGFSKDGGEIERFKIVRFNRKGKICIVEPITLYTEDEINAMDRHEAETIIKGKNND